MSSNNKRSLSVDPLGSGIFTPTTKQDDPVVEKVAAHVRPILEEGATVVSKDKTNIRLPVYLIDWLDDLTKSRRRSSKSKITKEAILQAALELLLSCPIDWENLEDTAELAAQLNAIRSQLTRS